MPDPHHPVNILSAVDYFKAKLQYESTPGTLYRLLEEKDSIVVLDVRDAESYSHEHIRGAINIPLAELPHRFAEVPRDKTIVTCSWSLTCTMAAKAALELGHLGFKVLELMGGIYAWKSNGLPVEGAGRA